MRYWVIVFAVTLAMITYIDRVSISFAAPFIRRTSVSARSRWAGPSRRSAGLTRMFEIPGGFLGDWIGPRKVLMRIVLWWSVFTAATGWAWSFPRSPPRVFCSARARPAASPTSPRPSPPGCRPGTRARAGHHVAERALGGRVHAAAGGRDHGAGGLAPRVRTLRLDRPGVGGRCSSCGFATTRCRSPASTPPSANCCKASAAWPPATRMCRGGSCCARGRYGCSAASTSASTTAGISTSPGCPVTCGRPATWPSPRALC